MLLDLIRALFAAPVTQLTPARASVPVHQPRAVVTPFTSPTAMPAGGKDVRDPRGRFTPAATIPPTSAAWRGRTQTPGQIACPDILSLVVFDHHVRLVQPFVGAFDAAFAKAVTALPGQVRGGMTDMTAGLALANDILARQPRGLLRRIWLLSDGNATPADQQIGEQVNRARAAHTNINTIGIGNPGGYDRALLERISAGTHNGRFAEADTVAKLDTLFAGAAGPRPVGSHRGEATVFLIDVSGSMTEAMGNARRIDAVAAAMLGLLRFKQARWS